jgi:hypothetical protein
MLALTVKSASEQELSYIAGLNYGLEQSQHLDALRKVIFEQGGALTKEQYWFPYEVIELGAHALAAGHEREFAICTLLVIEAVRSGYDTSTDLSAKFSDRSQQYDMLPGSLRDEILIAYQAAGC